jgi:hypothetical protein
MAECAAGKPVETRLGRRPVTNGDLPPSAPSNIIASVGTPFACKSRN